MQQKLQSALSAFSQVVGKKWIFCDGEVPTTYSDELGHGRAGSHCAPAVVLPSCTAEVQEIIRIANQQGVPLWPVSRGRNVGYGGGAPLRADTVVLDLQRMQRILAVDERLGVCVVEPGVSFVDLFRYLRDNRIPLWVSAPGNANGSVIGNALERGVGYTPYGDHVRQLCGLEVVLPDGSLLRTGMGAMSNARTWHHYNAGLGPSWDALFVQSSFGVVTRAGVWLMPEPEATRVTRVALQRTADLDRAVEAVRDLQLRGLVEHPVVIGSVLHEAAVLTPRDEWYCGRGSMPPEVLERVREHYSLGRWNFSLMLFGYEEVIAAQAEVIRRLLGEQLEVKARWSAWHRGEAIEASATGVPTSVGMNVMRWYGPLGSHICCAPVLPAVGGLALEHAAGAMKRFEEHGLDYYSAFTVSRRHLVNVNTILFDASDAEMAARARALGLALQGDARLAGYGEYRAHLDFMEFAADAFDFNDHALMRLNERVKDALDPRGILAPGKSGIWAAGDRERG